MQQLVSQAITNWLEAYGNLRDQGTEAIFHAVYGSPWLQALMGVTPNESVRPKPGTTPEQRARLAATIETLRNEMDQGGPLEAIVRSLIYIAAGEARVDARSFGMLRRILDEYPHITLPRYKAVVREQWAMLTIDEEAAMRSLPRLLPPDPSDRRKMFDIIRSIRTAAGELEGEPKRRLDEVEGLFELNAAPAMAISS
jgi:hypothetical protein